MALSLHVWEALPEINKYTKNGNLVIKKSDGYCKPTHMGEIYVCCGRAFLTVESRKNHTEGNCLLLEENSEKRPKKFKELSNQKYLSNLLLLKPACEEDKIIKMLSRRYNLPFAVVVLEKMDPSVVYDARRKKKIPHLSPVKMGNNNKRLSPTLSDDDDENGLLNIKPVSTPRPPPVLSTSFGTVVAKILRKPFQCVYCVFASKFFSNLSNHYKRQHPDSEEADVNYNLQTFSAKPMKRIHAKAGGKYQICKLCSRRVRDLKDHIKNSHVDNGKECKFCNSSFSSTKGLKVHIQKVHKAILKYSTAVQDNCSKEGSKRLVRDEQGSRTLSNMDTPDSLKCDLCHIKLSSDLQLINHKNDSHVLGSQYRCIFCPCGFKDDISLQVHLASYHKAKQIGPVSHSPKSDSVKERTFKCTECVWKFKTVGGYQRHKEISHVIGGLPCKSCSCSFATVIGLKIHIKHRHKPANVNRNPSENSSIPTKLSPSCTEKNPRRSVGSRKNGMCNNDGSNQQSILICPKQGCHCPILDQETLENHWKLVHSRYNRDSLSCRFCTENFSTKLERKSHHDEKHSKLMEVRKRLLKSLKESLNNKEKKKGVICELCPFKINSTVSLNYHLRTAHNPDFQYQCPNCPCRFETERKLDVHKRRVHYSKPTSSPHKTSEESSTRQRTCLLCCKRQKDKNDLILHMQTAHVPHGEFKCYYCSCCYDTDVGRRMHIQQTHKKISNEETQNFICPICGSTKSTMDELNEHKMTAHVENGLACGLCSCKFANQLLLDSHVKKDHAENETNENVTNAGSPRIRACRLKTINYKDSYGDLVDLAETNGETIVKKLGKHTCTICASTFQTSTLLSRHILTCHDESHIFSCKECPCVFANQKGVDVHCAVKHKKIDQENSFKRKRTPSPTPSCNSNKEANISYKRKSCQDSLETFSMQGVDSRHNGLAETIQVEEGNHIVDDDWHMEDANGNVIDSSLKDVGNPPDVEVISNSCSTPSVILINSPQREPTNPVSEAPPSDNFLTCRCKKCSIIFLTIDLLLEHLKMKHKVNTLFKCSLCKATFVNPLLLTKHLKVHAPDNQVESNNKTEENNSEAPPNKKFRNNYYNAPMAKDSANPKHYRCQKCGHTFGNVASLAQHIMGNHDVSDFAACAKCGLPCITGDLVGFLEHEQACIPSVTCDSLNRFDKELASAYNRNTFSAVTDVSDDQINSNFGNKRKSFTAPRVLVNPSDNSTEIIQLDSDDENSTDSVEILLDIGNLTKGGRRKNNDDIRFECFGNSKKEVEYIKSTNPISVISLSDESNDGVDFGDTVLFEKSNAPTLTNGQLNERTTTTYKILNLSSKYDTVSNDNINTTQSNHHKDLNAVGMNTPPPPWKPKIKNAQVALKSTGGISVSPRHRSKIFLDRFFGRKEITNPPSIEEQETVKPDDKSASKINEKCASSNNNNTLTGLNDNQSKDLSADSAWRDADCGIVSDNNVSNASTLHNIWSDSTITDCDYSDVDYSDLCFKCGESVLNLKLHEMTCPGSQLLLESVPVVCNDSEALVNIDGPKIASENASEQSEEVTEESVVAENVAPDECRELCVTCGNTFASLKEHESDCSLLQMELCEIQGDQEKMSSLPQIVDSSPSKLTKPAETFSIELSAITVSEADNSPQSKSTLSLTMITKPLPSSKKEVCRSVEKRSCTLKNTSVSSPSVSIMPRFTRSNSVTSELSTSSFSDTDSFSSDSPAAKSKNRPLKPIKKKCLTKTFNSPHKTAGIVGSSLSTPVSVTINRSPTANKPSPLKNSNVAESESDEPCIPKSASKRKSLRIISSSDESSVSLKPIKKKCLTKTVNSPHKTAGNAASSLSAPVTTNQSPVSNKQSPLKNSNVEESESDEPCIPKSASKRKSLRITSSSDESSSNERNKPKSFETRSQANKINRSGEKLKYAPNVISLRSGKKQRVICGTSSDSSSNSDED